LSLSRIPVVLVATSKDIADFRKNQTRVTVDADSRTGFLFEETGEAAPGGGSSPNSSARTFQHYNWLPSSLPSNSLLGSALRSASGAE
jgi:hypothetical protein